MLGGLDLHTIAVAVKRALTTLGFVTTKGDLLTYDTAQTRKAVGTDGYLLAGNSGDTDGLRYLPPGVGFSLINGYLDWTAAAGVLTCSVLGLDGSAPSATNPVYAWVRNATATSGVPTLAKLTAATTGTFSSGSTGGVPANNTAFRIWASLFDDAGTYRIGLINCLLTSTTNPSIYPLAGWGIASSTAEGGAGAADSAHVFYTGTAVAAKPYAVLGYATWETGLAAIGTWVAPTRKQLFGPGVPLPGTTIAESYTSDSAYATTSVVIPVDDTIPQSTEGAQFMSLAHTPNSAANVLEATHGGIWTTAGADNGTVALFRDSVADALTATLASLGAANNGSISLLRYRFLAGGTTAITLKIRAGRATAAALYFNGQAAARVYGGVAASNLAISEVMA